MGHLYLDAHQLRQMRETQEAHFQDVATIKRITRTPDGKGGWVTGALSTIASDVPCTFTPAQQLVAGGQADRGLEMEKHTITFPWGTDVQDADVIELSAWSLQIQIEDAKHSKTRGTAVRCNAEDVKGNTW